ncbi:MAG TPA: SpoIVB peptidase S55 domain-containing protein [Bryobacteraceae bacterium]|nr:SpoIVB peptidase S55 domain-containing protein [Bryobacteraceae bacterium]
MPALRAFSHCITVACFCALRAQTPPPLEFFPISEIRPGLKGVGRTVFSGTAVEEFQVEILGTLENAGPKQSIILGRLSGGPLERTGVMQGMSGSPVYIDGKLAGAVAMAFPFSKEPIAGIRPIAEMLAGGDTGLPRAVQAALVRTYSRNGIARNDGTELVNLATPLSFNGFTRATLDAFAPQLRAIGLEPRQGLSAGRQPTELRNTSPLEPGSMISVQLITGDLSVGADGTVTHIDGKRVYAFGHRFLSVGPTEVPFTRASVLALLPNVSTSFKISASGDWLGSITSDRNAAVAGELGRRPRMTPVTISVAGLARPIEYKMEMAQDRLLSPMLLQMAIYSALDATERTLGSGAVRIRGEVEFDNLSESLRFDTIHSGDFNVPLQTALSTAMPLGYALQNSVEDLRVRKVNIALDSFTVKKQASIENAWLSRREARPGENVEIMIEVAGESGVRTKHKLAYNVPIGSPVGTLNFTVGDGPTVNAAEQRYYGIGQPRPAKELVSFLNSLRSNTKGYVRVWRADAGFQIDGKDLPDPPPSIGSILTRTQTGTSTIPRTSTIAEMVFASGDVSVTGSKTLQLEVKE